MRNKAEKRAAARRAAGAVVLAALLLTLAACGRGGAATMRLRRTEGTVSVSNGSGKSVPVLDNLGLYSGYGVGTQADSYAWIDLDDVKLTKLDQNSEIVIRKEGKLLDIEVKSGSLYFNVSEPLEDDETMSIRTSTMLVGIRGTSGWVTDNDGLSRVYILSGKVECSAEEQTVRVSAGEFAELTEDGELAVREFPDEDIPAFVRDEVGGEQTYGPEPTGTPELTPTPAPTPSAAVVSSGDCGENLTWTLDENGTLTISGTGPMEDFRLEEIYDSELDLTIISATTPWYNDYRSVTKIAIEDGVTSIGEWAFDYCRSLTSVTIPNSVTSIGASAFSRCENLTSVIIGNSVTSIGDYAFNSCYDLTEVTIGNSVTRVGNSVFSACWSLTDVYYGGSENQWNQIDFGSDNDDLLNATIHYNS